ncbi:MAG: hypothetical protein FJ271_31365 [Planctomycetes bacterium]|nr:hypothetical protein [Planctomycetota bacterium]
MSSCRRLLATMLVVGACVPAARAQETSFNAEIDRAVGDRTVTMTLTGSAVRKKLFFQVYSIASYVEKGVSIRTAEQLAAANVPKQLHLIMLRNVSGPDMADAFESITRKNYPAPVFADEIKTFSNLLRSRTASSGDHFFLTHIPKVGLEVKHLGKETVVIRNPQFSQAVWDNYLGRTNVGEDVKRGLISKLQ